VSILDEKISVIIPANNEEERIKDCILQFKPYVDEVIVIEDGSADRTYEIAERYARVVRFHGNKEPHQASLYNFGKTLTNTDWILVSDVDEVWPEEFLRNIRCYLKLPVLSFAFPRDNSARGENTWPDLQTRLVFRLDVEWRDEVHAIPYSISRNKPMIEVSCHQFYNCDNPTSPTYVIKHLPRNPKVKRPWW